MPNIGYGVSIDTPQADAARSPKFKSRPKSSGLQAPTSDTPSPKPKAFKPRGKKKKKAKGGPKLRVKSQETNPQVQDAQY